MKTYPQMAIAVAMSSAALLAGENLVTWEYPVGDLVQRHPDYPAPPMGLVKGPREEEEPEKDGTEKDRMQELVRMARTAVTPGAWKDGATLVANKDRLKVTAPESAQREVAKLLGALRSRTRMVQVETTLFSLDPDEVRRLSPSVRGALGLVAFLGSTAAPSGKEREEVAEAVSRVGRHLESPRVTAWDRQLSHSQLMDQKVYLCDVERVGNLAQPVVGVLNYGAMVEVRPAIAEGGKQVVLDLHYTLVELLGSHKTVVQGITVETPEVVRTEFNTSIGLECGVWYLAGVSLPREGSLVGLLVKADLLGAPAAGR